MIKVLFVCLGNICRSPTAHAVFEKKVANLNLADTVTVDSCGTGDWHIGQAPDQRSQDAAQQRGYDLSVLSARQLCPQDFESFDYILAMDARNMADILKCMPSSYAGQVQLFLDYATDNALTEVPDPYFGDEDGFERVLNLVESASDGLLAHIQQRLA